jgi:4-amino-4-deoxy-L-arabinose transferase-like glycosyltransferase
MTSQKNQWVDWLIISLLILLPRIFELDTFLTADEPVFMDEAQNFVTALTAGNLAQTLGSGYPAVTVSLLVASVVGDGPPEMALFGVGRLVVTLFGALLTLILFGLSRRLLGRWPALIGVGLLSLDPYALGYSRLLHSASLMALLMTLASVCWLLWLSKERWWWPAAAGLFAGLAFLTKTTALLLGPMLAIATVVWGLSGGTWRSRHWWLKAITGAVVLLGATIPVVVVLWPAMWVIPFETLLLTFGRLFSEQEAGIGNLGMFWLGRFVEDPGPAFYPVAFLLKSTPWLLAGLILSLFWLFRGNPPEDKPTLPDRSVAPALWGLAIIYLLIMTFASKKSVRYLLPAFPVFYLLVGLALTQTGVWLQTHFPIFPHRRLWQMVLVTGGFATVSLLTLFYYPYYLTYYNPLVLGWRWAPHTLLVGWGEGLDKTGQYLQTKPGRPEVTAWYEGVFPYLYDGPVRAVVPRENMLTTAQTVLYINQVQRDIPGPNIIHYFQSRRRPEYTARLNGIDYAWVYPGPIVGDTPPPAPAVSVGVNFDGQVHLSGYTLESGQVRGGEPAVITLFWQVLASPATERFVFLRLLDDQGQLWAQSDSPVVMGLWPVDRWQAGMFIEDAQELVIPAGTPPGSYQLEIGMYDPATNRPLPVSGGQPGPGGGVIVGEVPVAWSAVTVPDHIPDTQVATPMSDNVALVGHSAVPVAAKSGDQLALEMLWQEASPWWSWDTPRENNVLFTWTTDDGAQAEQLDPLPLPIDQWGQGAVLRSRHKVLVPATLASGVYRLQATLHTGSDPAGPAQLLAAVEVSAPPHDFTVPDGADIPAQPARLALVPKGRISLVGYETEPGDDQLVVKLYWQTDTIVPTNYTVFVQLLTPDNRVISQSDSTPALGERPTAGWVMDEVISDRHSLPLAEPLPSGPVRLVTGMYNPVTGQRLPLVNEAGEVVGDAILVAEVSGP